MMPQKIRNFCIIAHIDHGKSTLADRFLELTGTIQPQDMREQLLDRMDLERERGITIKLQPVRMHWQNVTLNLIDTPGHVDFTYEVSRSLAACEGAILVVDATKGVQAQTINNLYMALEAGLTIIPVINKIDLAAAQIEETRREICGLLDCSKSDVLLVSAKTGAGVEQLLDTVVSKLPPPSGEPAKTLRALVFDSIYDEYRGVVLFIRVVDGSLKSKQNLGLIATKTAVTSLEVGYFAPDFTPQAELGCGEIGYVVTNLKSIEQAGVGDTLTDQTAGDVGALAGYKPVKPFVFAGVFPLSNDQYKDLKQAVLRLKLNDASLQYEAENSPVLGFGFRMGFLGLLHLEIIKQRLEREYGLDLVVTNPSTEYHVSLTNGSEKIIHSATELPEPSKISQIKEPWIKGEVVLPKAYLGSVLQLINQNRGLVGNTTYLDAKLAVVNFTAPLADVLTDFYDRLKSLTSGYGSFNYELDSYKPGDLARLDILVAGEIVDSFSLIVPRSKATALGREFIAKLKEVIPRQLFEVSLQAAVGSKILAREDIKALGKNVTAHLYGGDITRKRKLWEKQKAGKQKMKRIGKVDIPTEAFMAMLKKS